MERAPATGIRIKTLEFRHQSIETYPERRPAETGVPAAAERWHNGAVSRLMIHDAASTLGPYEFALCLSKYYFEALKHHIANKNQSAVNTYDRLYKLSIRYLNEVENEWGKTPPPNKHPEVV